MARGDNALAGIEEKDIPSHRFPPHPDKERKVMFKGYYFSVFNQQTEDNPIHINNAVPSTEYAEYTVPAGYTVYVRGASVYFTVA